MFISILKFCPRPEGWLQGRTSVKAANLPIVFTVSRHRVTDSQPDEAGQQEGEEGRGRDGAARRQNCRLRPGAGLGRLPGLSCNTGKVETTISLFDQERMICWLHLRLDIIKSNWPADMNIIDQH